MDKFTLLEYMTGHLTAEDLAEFVCDEIHANEYISFDAQETINACLNLGISLDDLEEELDLCGSNLLDIDDFDVEGAHELQRPTREKKAPAKKKTARKGAPLVFLP